MSAKMRFVMRCCAEFVYQLIQRSLRCSGGLLRIEAALNNFVPGDPIGTEDDKLYPYITEEVRLFGDRINSGRPVLGICLGAQMMARTLAARVKPMGVKEIGLARYLSLTQPKDRP